METKNTVPPKVKKVYHYTCGITYNLYYTCGINDNLCGLIGVFQVKFLSISSVRTLKWHK